MAEQQGNTLPIFEKEPIDGTGRVILYEKGAIIKLDEEWFYVPSAVVPLALTGHSSLIQLVIKSLQNVTTRHLREFLQAARLSMKDIFLDNPEETYLVLMRICKDLLHLHRIQGGTSDITMDNLKSFINDLKTEKKAAFICQRLRETIASLQVESEKRLPIEELARELKTED